MRLIALLSACVALSACVGPSYRDPGVTIAAQRDFQPERYLGRWYEIARYPVSFEEGCTATTAEYSGIDGQTISVLNTCRKGGFTFQVRHRGWRRRLRSAFGSGGIFAALR